MSLFTERQWGQSSSLTHTEAVSNVRYKIRKIFCCFWLSHTAISRHTCIAENSDIYDNVVRCCSHTIWTLVAAEQGCGNNDWLTYIPNGPCFGRAQVWSDGMVILISILHHLETFPAGSSHCSLKIVMLHIDYSQILSFTSSCGELDWIWWLRSNGFSFEWHWVQFPCKKALNDTVSRRPS